MGSGRLEEARAAAVSVSAAMGVVDEKDVRAEKGRVCGCVCECTARQNSAGSDVRTRLLVERRVVDLISARRVAWSARAVRKCMR